MSGKIGQQGENIDQTGTVNNDDGHLVGPTSHPRFYRRFNINGGQTVSGGIGQQGENIDQSGTVNNGGVSNNDNTPFYPYYH